MLEECFYRGASGSQVCLSFHNAGPASGCASTHWSASTALGYVLQVRETLSVFADRVLLNLGGTVACLPLSCQPACKKAHAQLCCSGRSDMGRGWFQVSPPLPAPLQLNSMSCRVVLSFLDLCWLLFSLPVRLYTNTSISITIYSHVLYTIAWGTQANDCIAGISNSIGKYKYSFQT